MKQKHLKISLFDHFECIGSSCPDSCCWYSWNIKLDESNRKQWSEIEDTKTRAILTNSIIKTLIKPGVDTYKVKQKENGQCVHFNSDGLCWIHATLGERYLASICNRYPRKYWNDSFMSYSSVLLSCPEVVRLLFEKGLTRGNLSCENNTVNEDINREISIDSIAAENLFNLTSDAIESKKYPVNVTLLHIAKVLCEIAVLSQKGQLDISTMSSLCSNSNQKMYKLNNDIRNNKFHVDPETAGRFWKIVYTAIPNVHELLPSAKDAYDDNLVDVLSVDQQSEEYFREISSLALQYREAFHGELPEHYMDRMKSYISVKFLNNRFPWNPVQGNVIAGYLYCVIPYAIIQLLIWIQFKRTGEILLDDIVAIIYRTERKLDHSTKIFDALSRNLQLLRLDTYWTCLANV